MLKKLAQIPRSILRSLIASKNKNLVKFGPNKHNQWFSKLVWHWGGIENNIGTKETYIDGLSNFFVRHDAIIKAHQDEIKWPSWPQAYKCLGKEGKTVNQKVALLHVPPGHLIDRDDNGPKMHHYLWPASRHQMLPSCLCQNRKCCSKYTGLVTFCSAKVCQKPGSLCVCTALKGNFKRQERCTWFCSVSPGRRLRVCGWPKCFEKSKSDSEKNKIK